MKIGIVGTGMVGSSAAYAMVMNGIGREIVMIDKDRQRAEAEAADLSHAVPFANPLRIRAGDYADLAGARAVVIAAGVGRKPDESRLQLLERNAGVFAEVVPRILEQEPEAILVVATNPVDIMTHMATRYAAAFDVPSTRVIGSGTTLDTARFRALIGARFGVDPRHVHAYVIGEHGDSEVLTWSAATIAGLSLDEFSLLQGVELTAAMKAEIDHDVRKAAPPIIAGKGATYYGIGAALARIVRIILHDQRGILTICTMSHGVLDHHDVTVSFPHLVGGAGMLCAIAPTVDEGEREALSASVAVVREATSALEAQS
jgi:L-lactate dehydrogenase